MNDALLQSALRLHQAGRLAEASRIYSDILRIDPRHFQALYLFAFVHLQSGQLEDAQRLIGEAIKINPRSHDAHYNRGCALQGLGRHEEALTCFDAAIALHTNYDEALINRGAVLLALKRHMDALTSFDAALALKPADTEALASRGNALMALGRIGEALTSFDKALALAPNRADLWNNRGAALLVAKRPTDALAALDRAIAIDRNDVQAVVNRSYALIALNHRDEALVNFDRTIAANPNSPELRDARADMLSSARRFEDAARDYAAVLALAPDYKYARGNLAVCRLQSCDWSAIAQDQAHIARALRAGQSAVNPFHALALSDSPEDLRRSAHIWAADKYPPQDQSLWQGERYAHTKIRVAYMSADFNEHAVSTLMAGVFGNHDRDRFETYAISFATDQTSKRRPVLMQMFDRFVDVADKSDFETARLMREMEIDIAVDLMGFTGDCRPGILAFRPAPVQVNYLGFPGTLDLEQIDYLIADRTVIPDEDRDHYREQIVYLPDTYLPNDSSRAIAERTPARCDAGLPDDGFVFCSFNNSYKFLPQTFDIWMRLLKQVPDSVLWLPQNNDAAMRNLQREAAARGVDAKRLVFAPFLDNTQDHLARLKLADIFLDTLPYNAHSTACDALWAGLPLLTCMGAAFAGRVAASLLQAIGLPELITATPAEYETLALKLACEPGMLKAIREKLARNRQTHPLFDTERFTRNLEDVYREMLDRAGKRA